MHVAEDPAQCLPILFVSSACRLTKLRYGLADLSIELKPYGDVRRSNVCG